MTDQIINGNIVIERGDNHLQFKMLSGLEPSSKQDIKDLAYTIRKVSSIASISKFNIDFIDDVALIKDFILFSRDDNGLPKIFPVLNNNRAKEIIEIIKSKASTNKNYKKAWEIYSALLSKEEILRKVNWAISNSMVFEYKDPKFSDVQFYFHPDHFLKFSFGGFTIKINTESLPAANNFIHNRLDLFLTIENGWSVARESVLDFFIEALSLNLSCEIQCYLGDSYINAEKITIHSGINEAIIENASSISTLELIKRIALSFILNKNEDRDTILKEIKDIDAHVTMQIWTGWEQDKSNLYMLKTRKPHYKNENSPGPLNTGLTVSSVCSVPKELSFLIFEQLLNGSEELDFVSKNLLFNSDHEMIFNKEKASGQWIAKIKKRNKIKDEPFEYSFQYKPGDFYEITFSYRNLELGTLFSKNFPVLEAMNYIKNYDFFSIQNTPSQASSKPTNNQFKLHRYVVHVDFKGNVGSN